MKSVQCISMYVQLCHNEFRAYVALVILITKFIHTFSQDDRNLSFYKGFPQDFGSEDRIGIFSLDIIFKINSQAVVSPICSFFLDFLLD